MKNLKSHFKFNKQERSGIFFLLLIIVLLQAAYFFYTSIDLNNENVLSVDLEFQEEINELKKHQIEKNAFKTYPFNPNFITDYKGYTLGMSVNEINRLLIFRATDKYINSVEEFQAVTQVSDSLLESISPYFKFPEWTKNIKKQSILKTDRSSYVNKEVRGINKVTALDLMEINGIGEKLSARIIKFRNRLGGFIVDEQLYDVYGLEPDVVQRTLEKYKVLNPPEIKKVNINTASKEEIAQLVYIQYNVAQKIVEHRENIGVINSFKELEYIEDFPSNKIDRIQLYLSLR